MEKTIILVQKETIKKTAVFFSLLGISIVLPAIIHSQPITGTVINSILFIAALFFAPEVAILIGLLPSIVALSSGLLPIPLAPMAPFIMIGNTILVLSFSYLKKKNFLVGVFIASFLKFGFLLSTSTFLIKLLVKEELAKQVSLIMSWPQFLTALSGGIIAYTFFKIFRKN